VFGAISFAQEVFPPLAVFVVLDGLCPKRPKAVFYRFEWHASGFGIPVMAAIRAIDQWALNDHK